jgi:AAA family ATP:ADP antiporter
MIDSTHLIPSIGWAWQDFTADNSCMTFATSLLKTIGMNGLLLTSAGLMGLIGLIVMIVERKVQVSDSFQLQAGVSDQTPRSVEKRSDTSAAIEGARLVVKSRYLAAIVGILGFYEITSQVMDYQFKLLTEPLAGVVETQAYMANVYFFANLLSVVVQLFLVSLIMRKLGLTVTLLVLPVALLISSLSFLAVPTLVVASFLVISDNGLNYSIQQTGRETLWVVTSAAEKYKARAFSNMFVQRAAKGLGIFAAFVTGFLGIPVRYLSIVTIFVLSLMILCSICAGRRFLEKSEQAEKKA